MTENFIIDIQIANQHLKQQLVQWLNDCAQLQLGHVGSAHLSIWDSATYAYQRQLGQSMPAGLIVMAKQYDSSEEQQVLMSGALDYVHEGLAITNLILRLSLHVQRLQHLNELESLTITDNLTGVYNRRKFDQELERCWRQSKRQQTPCALLLIDVDYFKLFNDAYGHLAGDQCLREIALTFKEEAVRPHDTVARIGGEEFAVILPDTPKVGAEHVANRILKRVRELRILNENTPLKYITVSAGIACITPAEGDKLVTLQSRADDALYQAKADGRNCVVSELNATQANPHIFSD
ncbi:GGDEF domain-containing protein [Bermanella sp. R86510]|uniref:GGDEF domain-containing protein n=1 Tax=unclassified Bermanella TaxID=2627862 RepID=UPI0037C61CC0